MSNYDGGRIQSIDAIRGLCVVLMCIHHFLFDLVVFCRMPQSLFSNPVFNVLHFIFAGTFIMLSGVSSRFSASNVKRGAKVIACALIITLVTWFIKMPVIFGVLHFLGVSMILYGLGHRLFERLARCPVTPAVYAVLIALTAPLANGIRVKSGMWWMFGFIGDGFASNDFFPLLPWFFAFLIGAWLGGYIKAGRFPKRFYTISPPVLPAIGRRALIIYMVHQPVLYAATLGLSKLMRIL